MTVGSPGLAATMEASVLPGFLVLPDFVELGCQCVGVVLQQWLLIIPSANVIGVGGAVVVVGVVGWEVGCSLSILLVVQEGIDWPV